jgi:hypothetical protein
VGRLPSPRLALASVLDWERTGWVYRSEGRVFFQTFWARFGWSHVKVPDFWYGVAGWLSILGLVGNLVSLFQGIYWSWESSLQRALFFLFIAGLMIWGGAWLRVHPFHGMEPFLPSARYALPAFLPVALLLIGGSMRLVPKSYRTKEIRVFLGLTFALDVASLWAIIRFYHF